MFTEVLLIEKAKSENHEERSITLQKAREMEIRLLVTLENDGCNLLTKMTGQNQGTHEKEQGSECWVKGIEVHLLFILSDCFEASIFA